MNGSFCLIHQSAPPSSKVRTLDLLSTPLEVWILHSRTKRNPKKKRIGKGKRGEREEGFWGREKLSIFFQHK
jgi:hypothetical protein